METETKGTHRQWTLWTRTLHTGGGGVLTQGPSTTHPLSSTLGLITVVHPKSGLSFSVVVENSIASETTPSR